MLQSGEKCFSPVSLRRYVSMRGDESIICADSLRSISSESFSAVKISAAAVRLMRS